MTTQSGVHLHFETCCSFCTAGTDSCTFSFIVNMVLNSLFIPLQPFLQNQTELFLFFFFSPCQIYPCGHMKNYLSMLKCNYWANRENILKNCSGVRSKGQLTVCTIRHIYSATHSYCQLSEWVTRQGFPFSCYSIREANIGLFWMTHIASDNVLFMGKNMLCDLSRRRLRRSLFCLFTADVSDLFNFTNFFEI